jgi:hypothetical protein
VFQNNTPNAPLVIEIYKAGANHLATGKALASKSIPVEKVGWSARNIFVRPNIRVVKGQEYVIVLKSAYYSRLLRGCSCKGKNTFSLCINKYRWRRYVYVIRSREES